MKGLYLGRLVPRVLSFVRLRPLQQRLTLGALGWLMVALLLRRCMPAEHLFPLAMPEDGTPRDWSALSDERRHAITERCAALERASRVLHIKNCLVRATALGLSLRRARIGSTLHIGVRKTDPVTLAAHAWVSIGGNVLIGDPTEQNYVDILPATLPSRRANICT